MQADRAEVGRSGDIDGDLGFGRKRQDRIRDLEIGFFPTKGRYDAAAVFRAATDAGVDPWSLLAAAGRTLTAFLKRRPGVERARSSMDPDISVVRAQENGGSVGSA
jgi:hypothetical protein